MDKLRVNGIRIKSAGSVVQNDKRDMSPMGGVGSLPGDWPLRVTSLTLVWCMMG